MPPEREEGQTDVLRYREPAVPMQDRPSPPTGQVPPWRLLLQLGGENRTGLGVTVTERMIVGRENSNRGYIPEIDLSEFDAVGNGVSREHALITCQEDGILFIEDLESTNGTRINGYELKTGRRYRLRDGDELEFGRLRTVIRFVRPSR